MNFGDKIFRAIEQFGNSRRTVLRQFAGSLRVQIAEAIGFYRLHERRAFIGFNVGLAVFSKFFMQSEIYDLLSD